MNKILLFIGLLLICCFVIVCYTNSHKIKTNVIIKIDDLIKTEKINIKKANKIIKVLDNKIDVENIVKKIMLSNKIEDGENIAYIGATYILEMCDKDNNILETIYLYIPQGDAQFIKLINLNEFYYLDVNQLLKICNLGVQ